MSEKEQDIRGCGCDHNNSEQINILGFCEECFRMDNSINRFVGKTLTKVENLDNERLIFTFDDGTEYQAYHMQDCCESVYIYDVVGDVDILGGVVGILNSPILLAEEEVLNKYPPDVPTPKYSEGCYTESYTWTIYHIRTEKGYVAFRWLGESNGYYSESVYLQLTNMPGEDG